MDDDLKLVLWICGLIATVIIALIIGLSVTSWHRTNRIADLVAKGADPIVAGCGVNGIGEDNRVVCALAIKH